MRKILIWVLCILLALGLAFIVGGYRLLDWVQGDGFRHTLEKAICNKAQADYVHIPENMRLEGNQATLPAISLKRADMLKHASARRITATLNRNALLDHTLHLAKINLEEASLTLDASRASAPLPPIAPQEDSFWNRFAPDKFALDSLECSDADIELAYSGNTYSLTGCSLTARPCNKRQDEWQLNLENGRLHNPHAYLQDCSVKTAMLSRYPEKIRLDECLLMLNPGELRLSGSYLAKSKKWNLEMRANKANVARLLPEDWKKRLSGELFGVLNLSGKDGQILKSGGSLTLKEAVLEGLPILSDLKLGHSKPYRSIALEKAECRISFPYSEPAHNISKAWLFDQIDIRSQNGSLLIRGHVIIGMDGSLSGTLSIGLPDHLFAALPKEPLANLFNSKGEAGYLWLNLNLSGTLSEPQEDLSARLAVIMQNFISQSAGQAAGAGANALNSILSGASKVFFPAQAPAPPTDAGQTPPAPLPGPNAPDVPDEQGPTGIIEGTGDLIEGGLRSLF